MRNRIKECKTALKGGHEGRSAEDDTLHAKRQVENGGTKLASQETEQHGASLETQKTQLPTDKSSASTKLQTAVSLGVKDLPSPLTEEQSQRNEKVN